MTKFKDIIFEKNVAIHCPEEWMADDLLKYADSMGYRWNSDKSYLVCNNWHINKRDTYYHINRGVYSHIDYAKENNHKILHYDDVAIKEGEQMETKLDYELWIKGRRAEIGSELWDRYGNKTIIIRVIINKEGEISIRCLKVDKSTTEQVKLSDVDNFLFWESPTIYQLPDTKGNLSEVKIGQPVWLKHNESDVILEYLISEFDGGNIKITLNNSHWSTYISNKEGLTDSNMQATTNKPSRFHGKQDWSQAPKKAVAWTIDRDGHAWWWENRPYSSTDAWDGDWGTESAGYRNDLINDRENMEVTDWRDSLVMRPKDV